MRFYIKYRVTGGSGFVTLRFWSQRSFVKALGRLGERVAAAGKGKP